MSWYPGRLVQYGYVVQDLEKGMAMWRRQLPSLGPFYLIENVPVEQGLYRGKPFELTMTAALAQANGVQVELLVQHTPGPSALKDTYRGGFCELNHIGVVTERYEEDLQKLIDMGHEVAMQGLVLGAMPFAYVDTVAAIGHMTEVIPARPDLLEMFGMVAVAAKDWDGKDPVRRIEV